VLTRLRTQPSGDSRRIASGTASSTDSAMVAADTSSV
jgi:hypothetical protein